MMHQPECDPIPHERPCICPQLIRARLDERDKCVGRVEKVAMWLFEHGFISMKMVRSLVAAARGDGSLQESLGKQCGCFSSFMCFCKPARGEDTNHE